MAGRVGELARSPSSRLRELAGFPPRGIRSPSSRLRELAGSASGRLGYLPGPVSSRLRELAGSASSRLRELPSP
ncbi:MAG: hypothetical protein OXQ28_05700, partial [Acidobacteriota bacterium]|nr:hypothetical protein [Acidobacteriota bacterium]